MLTVECVEGIQEWMEELGSELARLERMNRQGASPQLRRYGLLTALESHLTAALAVAVVLDREERPHGEGKR